MGQVGLSYSSHQCWNKPVKLAAVPTVSTRAGSKPCQASPHHSEHMQYLRADLVAKIGVLLLNWLLLPPISARSVAVDRSEQLGLQHVSANILACSWCMSGWAGLPYPLAYVRSRMGAGWHHLASAKPWCKSC